MAEADWERRLNRLEEAAMVSARLTNLMEQRMDRVEQNSESHGDDIAELRAAQAALFQIVDKLVRGSESNGHRGT